MKKLVLIPYSEYQKYLSILNKNNETPFESVENKSETVQTVQTDEKPFEQDNSTLVVKNEQEQTQKGQGETSVFAPPGMPQKFTIRKVGEKGKIKSDNWLSQWQKI